MSTPTDPSPTSGWLERWKGTNVWRILAWVHRGWDYLRGLGIAPSERQGPGAGDGGMSGPK